MAGWGGGEGGREVLLVLKLEPSHTPMHCGQPHEVYAGCCCLVRKDASKEGSN